MTGRIKQRNKDIAIYAAPYKFNGKELDEETGLYYYGARYLHPKYAMWLSTDPLEGTATNVSSYAYCHGNPIILIDPTGLYDYENTIKEGQNYNVIAVFPENYDKDRTLMKDHARAVENGIPVIIVSDVWDLSDAMANLSEIGVSTKAYALNSHGSAGGGEYNVPSSFKIGSMTMGYSSDFSPLAEGFSGKEIFIGACNVGSISGRGDKLVENMSKATNSLVIASCHPIYGGYEYDGSKSLNYWNIPFSPKDTDNKFIMSVNGSPFSYIRNVTIDKNRGINWDSRSIFYPFTKTIGQLLIKK